MVIQKRNCWVILAFLGLTMPIQIYAETDRHKMQEKLNEQILTKPFQSPSEATQNNTHQEIKEEGRPARSQTRDNYYRYWYNGYYYPYPFSYYGFPKFWYK